ncbi:MAG: FtsX-like permease family protein [Chloroflexi bacterium]|nr:FtsX-like permease family protein [Chloroflexota bacterium]
MITNQLNISVIWKKVWRDVSARKGRTVQVVLSIGVGIFAIGLTMGLLDIMEDRMGANWRSANPSHINIGGGLGALEGGPVGSGVTNDTIRAIGNMPGIEGAEGKAALRLRWKMRLEDAWEPVRLIARDDYDHQTYDKVKLEAGSWPVSGGVAVERGTTKKFKVSLDSTVYFEVDERPRAFRVVGQVYDVWAEPMVFGADAAFFVTRRDIAKLGGPSGFNQIVANLPVYDEDTAKERALDITDRLDVLNIRHGTPDTYDPEVHFVQDLVNGIFILLVVMSFLTLGLSLFLVVNTITAIVTEQVPQIGVMKAIGASSLEIFRIYLSNIAVYVVIALAIAIPLGVLGAYQFSAIMLGLFNMEAVDFKFPLTAVLVQLSLGLLAPMIAALWPVTAAARTTVRDAISGYGLAINTGLIDRVLSNLERLPPLVVMTISNVFRNKGRLAMTLIALVFSGAIFMMVMTVQASMIGFFDDFQETYRFDILIGFEKPQRVDSIETLVGNLPGITYAEMLEFSGAAIRRIDDEDELDEESLTLIGVSREGDAYGQVVTAGRYLLPEDERAVVLNEHLADELGVSVGENVVIEINGEDKEWSVVGLLLDGNDDQTASVVWLDVLLREKGSVGRGSTLFVGAENQEEAHLVMFSRELREWLNEQGKDVGFSLTSKRFTEQNSGGLDIIIYLLLVISVLIAVVGSVGLSGALSISALERQREVGVMRAIGASGRAVSGIFIGEGLMIGFISWLIALPLSIPLGILFSKQIADTMDFQFGYTYSPLGAVIWLGVVLILSIISSGLPAWRASRISVREVLSYE